MVLAPMLIIIFLLAVFNIINLFMVYKDFLTLTENSIVINYGLISKKKVLNISEIKNVKYHKSIMAFNMINGTRKSISLTFISKGDEIAIYEYLMSKSISIIM